jgi:lipoate-protein ligase B
VTTTPPFELLDLGRRDYESTMALQEERVERRKAGSPDCLILVEHEPVYTLGRNAKPDHVLLSPAEMKARGIRMVQTGRGGDVTFHGPGQLVGYPIVSLAERGKGVVWYVSQLETLLIDTLAAFGISAGVDPVNRGVWVGNEKMAALGVRVTRGVTMHGFALNVCADLNWYSGIVPCGIVGKGVTSMHRWVPDLTLEQVKQRVVLEFTGRFY